MSMVIVSSTNHTYTILDMLTWSNIINYLPAGTKLGTKSASELARYEVGILMMIGVNSLITQRRSQHRNWKDYKLQSYFPK